MKDMRKEEMRHVVSGTNPNEHIRTDSQIRAERKKKKKKETFFWLCSETPG